MMARKRLLSPEFFTHRGLYRAEKRSGLPLRVAFAGLWTRTDRRGVFRWDADALQVAILPFDDCEMAQVLDELDASGFVVKYMSQEGREFGYIPSFHRWQTFHVHEKPSKDPDPPNDILSTVPARCQHGAEPPITVAVAVTGTGTVETKQHTGDPLEGVEGYADVTQHLSPPAKAVFDGYCRGSRVPLAVVASVRALHERDGYAWAVVDRAVIEYGTVNAGDKLSAEALRRFCLKLTKPTTAGTETAGEAFLRAGT